jgi:hypothetical protein
MKSRLSVALAAAFGAVAMVCGTSQAGMADDVYNVYTLLTASSGLLLLGWLRRRRNRLMLSP